jgi:hypothetical protein
MTNGKYTTHGFYEKLEIHRGTPILQALKNYDTSGRILSGNAQQIRQLVKLLEDPADPIKTSGFDQRKRLFEFFDEVIRPFHNYLASITTLVDHTRNLMKENFVNKEHYLEYQGIVSEFFAKDPFTKFMQDFRNYMTHHAIPVIGVPEASVLPEADSKSPELIVDLDHLAKWDRWSIPSRKFIEANRPGIRMLKLVDDYERKIIVFQQELKKSFYRHYGQEIGDALAIIDVLYKSIPKSKGSEG